MAGSVLFLDVDDWVVDMFYDCPRWNKNVVFDTHLDLSIGYSCVVVEDALISDGEANGKLLRYFTSGGNIVILAVCGIYDVPSTLNDLFSTDWKFASYSADTYEVTAYAKNHFSAAVCELALPYTKANRLKVPDKEAMVLIKASRCGSSQSSTSSEDSEQSVSSSEESEHSVYHQPKHAPVAVHVGRCGGRLAYFGCCNADDPFVAMFRDLCHRCEAPQIELVDRVEDPSEDEAGVQSRQSASSVGVPFQLPAGPDQDVQEYLGFISDQSVWSWFRGMQQQYPQVYGKNDHPYNGDLRQHSLGTRLRNRCGETCTIQGSSFRTTTGDSPRENQRIARCPMPLAPMYKVVFDGDPDPMYMDFDGAHGPRANFKQIDAWHAQRFHDQKKASKAKDDVMEHMLVQLKSSKARANELERTAASVVDRMPSYWKECTCLADGHSFVRIGYSDETTWYALEACLHTEMTSWLGKGRDYAWKTDHSRLRLAEAWRIEHPVQYNKYAAAKEKVRADIQNASIVADPIHVPRHLEAATAKLPGDMEEALNEKYLLHGTSPDLVLPIISDGLNERLCGRPGFGFGCYLAEDAGKSNQYVTPDKKFDKHKELHRRLYTETTTWHPGAGTCYMFVCRSCIGLPARTYDGDQTLDGEPVWEGGCAGGTAKGKTGKGRNQKRELAYIPNTRQIRHHSAVVELTPAHSALPHSRQACRYREFIFPHGDRIYPEYLLAFYRE